MESTNPYGAPRAAVADVGNAYDGAFQEMTAWGWRGRLGRLRFLAYTMVAYLIYLVATTLIAVAAAASAGQGAGASMLVGGASVLLLIPYIVFCVLVIIRRSHDMNWSGWMSILAFIPLVGLIWLFKSGSPGANDYGAPPPPNTAGVKVAAFGIFGMAVVIGILAAIAIPAYQQYVQRAAQAAQQVPAK